MQNNLMKIVDRFLPFYSCIITSDEAEGDQWASLPHEAEDD